MNTLDLLDPEAGLPWRVRLAVAAVPVALGTLALAADFSWQAGVALLLAVSPWLLLIVDLCPPWPYAAAATIGAVTIEMARWRTTDLALMVLVFLVGQSGMLHPRRVSGAILAACVAVPVGWQLGSGYDRLGAWVVGMGMAWLCGVALRAQQLTMGRLQAAQEELATKAVADERRRIAREVHDLAAHSMAVTMLHLTGARLALADGEVAEAESALAAAERLGRSSLDEIRRAVGVLAEPTDGVARRPEPGVGDIAALVEDYRRAGMTVAFTESGAPVESTPLLGLTLFRLAQESLANAARHAPGAAVTMRLTWDALVVTLEVTNPLPTGSAGAGQGLVGMRERVAQLGGEFSSGAAGDVWQVRATLPSLTASLEPR